MKLTSPLSGITPVAAKAHHPVWGEIQPELTPRDFSDPYAMDIGFLRLLSQARRLSGVPFRVVSSYRTAEHNASITGVTGKVGGASRSAHTEYPCRAADLHVKNRTERALVMFALYEVGFRRFGIYKGNDADAGSVHVDGSAANPSPRIWTHY